MAFLLKRNASVFCSTVESGFDTSNTVRLNLVDQTFSYSQSSTIDSSSRDPLLGTDRGIKPFTSALDPATFSFTTYLTKSDTDLPDNMLWKHLANETPATDNTTVFNPVTFADSNTTQLSYLYFFFDHEGTVYKLGSAIISSATIEMNLEQIPTITWVGEAQSLAAEAVNIPSAASVRDFKGDIPELYGKLTTITCTSTAPNSPYTVVLTAAGINVQNNVEWVGRDRINQITTPETHYLGNREISGSFTFYLKTAGSKVLLDDVLSDLNANIQRTYDITLNFAGGPGKSCQIDLPRTTITTPNIGLDEVLTLDVDFFSEETTSGGANEITLTFN